MIAMLKNINPFILFVSLLASVIVVFAVWYWNSSNHINTFNSEAAAFDNRALPNVSLIETGSGIDFSEEVRRGDVFLIYLMSGCNACEKQIKVISENKVRLNPRAKVFGIMFEDEATVSDYIKKHNINFPILLDKDRKLLNDLNLKYFPANFQLENGIVKKTSFGASPDGKSL